ncbi:MAG TPA: zinc-binding dehydrogenase [Actinomycetota bacterium]|jgi:NADPH:quinone reductase-like Zn-dependent oxidoreductase|nr:zinc-binding dehydrogenase [Actinomycetota bacterium]
MRGLVAAPDVPGGIELREVAGPDPGTDEAVIDVRAVSLNRGECMALRAAEDGWRPGWDLAGVVAAPAVDGSGPAPGSRVVGWVNGGAWAERAAVRTDHLAELPPSVTFETASTLPVAGLTAVGVLAVTGSLLGSRVAITGAAGGVGRFAVQLAHLAGAHVTAVVGRPERGEGLDELGADEVVAGLAPDGEPYDLIVESAGGASLAAAIARVAARGVIVSFGNSSNHSVEFDPRTFYRKGGPTMLGFFVTQELLEGRVGSAQLAALASLVAEGRLRSQIDLQVPWSEAAGAIDDLLARRVNGKAVLEVG